MTLDEKITYTVIGLLLALGGLTVAPVILGERIVEPFTELGILGPNMKLGDYPRELYVGESVDLYLYLGNHEGVLKYYQVVAKLGDQNVNVSDDNPYPVNSIWSVKHVLLDESNQTIPIHVEINEVGLNKRLVFELYKYQDQEFVYDGIWVQLWLNVTEPQ
jgi:uncharacterized membrane protein